jgi:hypothetical protein
MLGERIARYRLGFARGLRSVYSTNLLRLLMTQKDTGFKTITPADKALSAKAEIYIEWKETKRSRTRSFTLVYQVTLTRLSCTV